MESSTKERSRTFQWNDPLISATAGRAMSGIDFLQAMGRGELPYPPGDGDLKLRSARTGDRDGKGHLFSSTGGVSLQPNR